MSIFAKPEVTILKESSDAKSYLKKLEELRKSIKPDSPEYKKIDKEISLVRAGILGEENILFELKNSGMDLVVLHDICLVDPDGNSAQIDFIVLTPYVIVFIECKNLFGNLEINSKGDFIRTIEYGGRKYKEGIYSPITQNDRHLLIYKKCRSANKGLIQRLGFEHGFSEFHKSLVVLANPKTIVNDRIAPKEFQTQVIRADQLIQKLKSMKSSIKCSKKELLALGESILSMNQEDRKDHFEKFNELKKALENPDTTIQTDIVEPESSPSSAPLSADSEVSVETALNDTEPLYIEEKLCPRCGSKLVLRTAKKGDHQGNQFWGCSRFPKCRYIENLSSDQK